MTKKVVLVCGHGPGISDAVARRFGKEGYAVAIVARNADRLASAASALRDVGVDAKAFPCELGDEKAVKKLVSDVRSQLGPIAVLHWNAYAGAAGDLLTAPAAELKTVLDVCVNGLVAAVQAALPDLEAQKGAALVTGGGLGMDSRDVNKMAVSWKSAGLAIGKAAQHKTVGLLNAQLADKGVYVGEVIVTAIVKGTAWDKGNGTLEADDIAQRFWDIASARTDVSVTI
jgi:NADP-dependent 3-hydroxy acid dehydrogenase YdfG